jgi:hypothetical protein
MLSRIFMNSTRSQTWRVDVELTVAGDSSAFPVLNPPRRRRKRPGGQPKRFNLWFLANRMVLPCPIGSPPGGKHPGFVARRNNSQPKSEKGKMDAASRVTSVGISKSAYRRPARHPPPPQRRSEQAKSRAHRAPGASAASGPRAAMVTILSHRRSLAESTLRATQAENEPASITPQRSRCFAFPRNRASTIAAAFALRGPSLQVLFRQGSYDPCASRAVARDDLRASRAVARGDRHAAPDAFPSRLSRPRLLSRPAPWQARLTLERRPTREG